MTNLKPKAADLLRSLDHGERAALVLLHLLAQSEGDVRKGRTLPLEQVFKELRGRLARKIGQSSPIA